MNFNCYYYKDINEYIGYINYFKIETLFIKIYNRTIKLISSFKMSFTTQEPIECPICFDVIGEKNNITTECGHKFHANCLMTNISRNGFSCPCCRSLMAPECPEEDDEEDDSSTLLDDEDETTTLLDENELYSDYALRGLRLLTNLVEGQLHDQEDVIAEYQSLSDEDDEEEDSTLIRPSIEFIADALKYEGVTFENLLSGILSDHCEYAYNEDFREAANSLWGKIRIIVTNYATSTFVESILSVAPGLPEPEIPVQEQDLPNFMEADSPITTYIDMFDINMEEYEEELQIQEEFPLMDFTSAIIDYEAQPKSYKYNCDICI